MKKEIHIGTECEYQWPHEHTYYENGSSGLNPLYTMFPDEGYRDRAEHVLLEQAKNQAMLRIVTQEIRREYQAELDAIRLDIKYLKENSIKSTKNINEKSYDQGFNDIASVIINILYELDFTKLYKPDELIELIELEIDRKINE